LTIRYFNALAGAGKTYALALEADRLARLGQKVLFVQPSKLLINNTIRDELQTRDPSYPIRAIHGDTDLKTTSVVGEIAAYFKQVKDGGEVLFITHAAFMRLSYIQKKGNWHLIIDEVPQVDVYEEWNLPATHHLITPYLELVQHDAFYGRLVKRESL
jgi:superfamily II DNA or RNA helicase